MTGGETSLILLKMQMFHFFFNLIQLYDFDTQIRQHWQLKWIFRRLVYIYYDQFKKIQPVQAVVHWSQNINTVILLILVITIIY